MTQSASVYVILAAAVVYLVYRLAFRKRMRRSRKSGKNDGCENC